MLYKVFLVEDEAAARVGIRDNVDWRAAGFEFCGEAPDGDIALPLIETTQPDLLISDIKMPFMDGLQLCKLVRQRMPWIKVVILSGHDEFDYAQSAIKLGVSEYLLKPITAVKLHQVLAKIAAQLDQEREEREKLKQLQSLLQDNLILQRERLLFQLVVGGVSSTEAIEQCQQIGLNIIAPYYLVALIKISSRKSAQHLGYTDYQQIQTTVADIICLDMLDTSISPLAGGTSHPPTETMVASLRNTPYDTGLDLASFLPITEHFRSVRRKYRQFESEFTGVDAEILTSQIPGGMLSNLAAQLTEQNALDRIKEVLDEVPRVRKEMGYPPLVTPTSQIVGTQATLNVLTGERYKVITTETKNYFLGLYGRAPGPLDRDIMARAIGDDHPIKTRPADRLEPELEATKKDLPALAATMEDQLSFTLFPTIARDFFEAREKGDLTLEPLESFLPSGPAAATELHLAPAEFNVTVHGETYHVQVSGSGRKVDGRKPYYIRVNDKLEEVSLEPIQEILAGVPEAPDTGASAKRKRPRPSKPGDVAPPMPGRVVKVLVSIDAIVKAGTPLLIIEAMKMESQVPAPIDGKVAAILVAEGDNVKTDETVIQLE